MKKKRKPIKREFFGIRFTRVGPGQWRSGKILLQRNHIGVKFEKWSVEEHPRGPEHRGTGPTIEEALENSDLLTKCPECVLQSVFRNRVFKGLPDCGLCGGTGKIGNTGKKSDNDRD